MAYKHGVYVSEIPTSIVPPVQTSAGLPVVFGTAPINLALDPAPANKPVLCYTYQEAVQQFGFSKDWANYTLCEFIYSQFALFGVGPVVLVNVLDPANHKTTVAPAEVEMTNGKSVIEVDGILLDSLTVKLDAISEPLVKDEDYAAAFNDDGHVVITRIPDGNIPAEQASLYVGYDKLDPGAVTEDDIIGGVNVDTGALEGLELVNQVFPLFRLVPGQMLALSWSQDTTVAAVMVAKASNINGHFKCIALTDVDTEEADNYTKVAKWKNDNNYTSSRQVVSWPKVQLGNDIFHLSTQLAGLICRIDAENEDIPYTSPSNKNLQCNGAVVEDGSPVVLGPDQAAYLNGEGVITALNFIGGWKAWGNRTGAYPAVTDPEDSFLPIRRMFDWIGNTLVQTFWQKVDFPINRRLIETIVDSANIWLNGLAAREFILGGRVEFLAEENPDTDLMDGIIKFHFYVTPPPPAREIDFIGEFDPSYLQTLFG